MQALYDHFRPPLSLRRHWHSFHSAWSTYLASHLNDQLPLGYFAETNVQFGIEIDVAAWEEGGEIAGAISPSWVAPAPTLTVPVTLITDVVEVLVYHNEGGPTLAAAIELISPANKDRPGHRDGFVSKCAAYVQQGIGLMIVDVVTERRANLHGELLDRLQGSGTSPIDVPLYAAAYRPVRHDEQTSLEIWYQELAIGRALPVLPLWLRGSLCSRVDLAATYARTCQEQRILAEGA